MKHSSKPHNPKLAIVFFKSDMIEAWGRGFEKMKEACGLYDDRHHDQDGHDMVMTCKSPEHHTITEFLCGTGLVLKNMK